MIIVMASSIAAEEDNCMCLNEIITIVATKTVKVKFDKVFPPSTLAGTISQNKVKLDKLKAKGRLNSDQYTLLTAGATSSDTYDITLMMLLIRNLSKTVSRPTGGFDCLPSDNEISDGADLARIKYYRNKICHSGKNKISLVDFNDCWKCVTEVLEGKSFEYDETVEKDFLTPQVKSVAEAIHSPVKGHISVQGYIDRASDIIKTDKSVRRVLSISNGHEIEGPQCTVKLWGEKTYLDIPKDEVEVIITNCEVMEFRGKKELNSTPLTVIKINAPRKVVQTDVEAACFDRNEMCIVLKDTPVKITEEEMGKIFPQMKFEEGIVVTCTLEGGKVISVDKVMNAAKKPKKD